MSRPVMRLVILACLAQPIIAFGSYGLMIAAERSGLSIFRNLERSLVFVDVPAYFRHADNAFAGQIPYRDDPIEYPILALPFVFLPRLIARTQGRFVIVFAIEMLAFSAALTAIVAGRISKTDPDRAVARRLAWFTAYFACLSPFVIGRYDVVPAFLAFAGAVAWFSSRSIAGGILSAVGTLTKVFPGVVAVTGIIGDLITSRPRRWKGGVAFGLTMIVGISAWFMIGGRGVVDSLRYHSERGIEVGSLASGFLWIVGRASGDSMRIVHDHESLNLVSSLSGRVAGWAILFQAVAMISTAGALALRKGRDPLRSSGAMLLAFVLFGKVLSPQYLIWVMPFVATISGPAGRLARPLFLVAAILTLVLYPWGAGGLRNLEGWAFVALNGRNLALLGTFATLTVLPSDES